MCQWTGTTSHPTPTMSLTDQPTVWSSLTSRLPIGTKISPRSSLNVRKILREGPSLPLIGTIITGKESLQAEPFHADVWDRPKTHTDFSTFLLPALKTFFHELEEVGADSLPAHFWVCKLHNVDAAVDYFLNKLLMRVSPPWNGIGLRLTSFNSTFSVISRPNWSEPPMLLNYSPRWAKLG